VDVGEDGVVLCPELDLFATSVWKVAVSDPDGVVDPGVVRAVEVVEIAVDVAYVDGGCVRIV
jgi:hypothetical protein